MTNSKTTDHQLLKDITELKSHLEVSFNKLIIQSEKLHQEAESKETSIRELVDKHQQTIQQIDDTIKEIGGSAQLESLLKEIKATQELLSQYPNINDQVSQNLDQYNSLVDSIQKKLDECSLAQKSLRENYNHVTGKNILRGLVLGFMGGLVSSLIVNLLIVYIIAPTPSNQMIEPSQPSVKSN